MGATPAAAAAQGPDAAIGATATPSRGGHVEDQRRIGSAGGGRTLGRRPVVGARAAVGTREPEGGPSSGTLMASMRSACRRSRQARAWRSANHRARRGTSAPRVASRSRCGRAGRRVLGGVGQREGDAVRVVGEESGALWGGLRHEPWVVRGGVERRDSGCGRARVLGCVAPSATTPAVGDGVDGHRDLPATQAGRVVGRDRLGSRRLRGRTADVARDDGCHGSRARIRQRCRHVTSRAVHPPRR